MYAKAGPPSSPIWDSNANSNNTKKSSSNNKTDASSLKPASPTNTSLKIKKINFFLKLVSWELAVPKTKFYKRFAFINGTKSSKEFTRKIFLTTIRGSRMTRD
jgi:hypothetical protein